MKDKVLLGIGILLVILSITKIDINGLFNTNNCVQGVVIEQIDTNSQSLVRPIIDILKNGSSDRKVDGKRLASLYTDLASLVKLDGDDQVITNTEEIKEANALAGEMLRLNIKDKYPNLSIELTTYMKTMIGDDNIALDNELRAKAVEAFRGLAWACNEGAK